MDNIMDSKDIDGAVTEPTPLTVNEILGDVTVNDDVAELVDGQTINVKTNDELVNVNVDGLDNPKVRENPIDYNRYTSLTDFFVEGLIRFCHMVSLELPEQFKKSDTRLNELNSTNHGIKACKTCISKLYNQLKGKRLNYKKPRKFKHLHQWYTDSLIEFMKVTMDSGIPEHLIKPDVENYKVRSAIDAFKQIRKLLLENLKGLSNVK